MLVWLYSMPRCSVAVQGKLFTAAMREEEVNNLRLHQALCDDLHSEGFHLVLQPIVSF